MKSSIIFENENLFALEKPTGIPSNPLNAKDEKETCVSFALQLFPELRKHFPDSFEPGLLHRLDLGTSGVLLFAKNREAFARLKHFWKSEAVRKFYVAWVTDANQILQTLSLPHFLTHPLARALNHKSKMIVIDRPKMRLFRGNPLEAHTKIISSSPLSQVGHGHILEIEILTGVMHQIRVHLSHAGLPILGDKLYRGAEHPRLALHASRLELDPVLFGNPISIQSLEKLH